MVAGMPTVQLPALRFAPATAAPAATGACAPASVAVAVAVTTASTAATCRREVRPTINRITGTVGPPASGPSACPSHVDQLRTHRRGKGLNNGNGGAHGFRGGRLDSLPLNRRTALPTTLTPQTSSSVPQCPSGFCVSLSLPQPPEWAKKQGNVVSKPSITLPPRNHCSRRAIPVFLFFCRKAFETDAATECDAHACPNSRSFTCSHAWSNQGDGKSFDCNGG